MSEIDESGVPLDACDGEGWYPQYRRSQKWARAEYPDGYSIELPARHAWTALTSAQRDEALSSLFHSYALLIHDEDNERRLDKEADNGTSYLKAGDVPLLWEYTNGSHNEHGEVPVDHAALLNVLCEVELLQHRLTRFSSRNDSGEPK